MTLVMQQVGHDRKSFLLGRETFTAKAVHETVERDIFALD